MWEGRHTPPSDLDNSPHLKQGDGVAEGGWCDKLFNISNSYSAVLCDKKLVILRQFGRINSTYDRLSLEEPLLYQDKAKMHHQKVQCSDTDNNDILK